MKKLVLCSICGLLCLTMVGCSSSSETQTLNNLSTQLDRMQNSVSNLNSSAVYDVTPMNYLYSQPSTTSSETESRLTNLLDNSQNYLAQHEQLKSEITSTCSTIKATLNQKYNLSKNKKKALQTLTQNISGYCADINNSVNNIKTATDSIKKYKKYDNINSDQLNVGYTQLNNEMRNRIALFSNVLNTIDQVESILNSSRETQNNNNNSNINSTTTNETTTNNTASRKNIDTYGNYANSNYSNNVNYQTNTNWQNNYQNQRITENISNNNYYDYNYNNRYWNGYNGYYRNSAFNPGRNTDTYLPRYRNIDTYRPLPRQIQNVENIQNKSNTVLPTSYEVKEKNNEAEKKIDLIQEKQIGINENNNISSKENLSEHKQIENRTESEHKIRRIPKSKKANEHIIAKTQEMIKIVKK